MWFTYATKNFELLIKSFKKIKLENKNTALVITR